MKSAVDIESEIIRMGDIGVAIDMVDASLAEGEMDRAERATFILKEIFASRYGRLRCCVYGGEESA